MVLSFKTCQFESENKKGAMSANGSIRALLDVTMSYFPDYIFTTHPPEAISTIRNTFERYLMRLITYEQAQMYIQSMVGFTQPLERLQEILDMEKGTPLPAPKGPVENTGNHKARPWSSNEDKRLLCGIFRHGIKNWTAISKFVGNGRTRSQCSQRWYRGLDPTICKEQWSKEEERKLLALVNEYGDKSWTRIATKMGNRSDVQCRYKYKQLQKELTTEELKGQVPLEPPRQPPASPEQPPGISMMPTWPRYPRPPPPPPPAPAPGFYSPYYPRYGAPMPPYVVVENPVQQFVYREQPQYLATPPGMMPPPPVVMQPTPPPPPPPVPAPAPVPAPPHASPPVLLPNIPVTGELPGLTEKEKPKPVQIEPEPVKEKAPPPPVEKDKKPAMSPISIYSIQSPGILMKPAKEHVTTTVITKNEGELARSGAAHGAINTPSFDVRMYSVY